MGALIQSFPPASNPHPMYLAGRFFVGFGSNICNGTCPLLITEISHPQHRGKITTLYNTLWFLGAILAAWVTYGTLTTLTGDNQWRLPTGLQCLMPGIQLLFLYFIPESPRWLISKGRNEEALNFLTKYHGNGDYNDAFSRWEFAEISETLRLEKEASASSGWYELVRTKGNRKRCFLIIVTAIFSQCSGNGLVSYYLSSILKTIGITEYKRPRTASTKSANIFCKVKKTSPGKWWPHNLVFASILGCSLPRRSRWATSIVPLCWCWHAGSFHNMDCL
jgi:MFS family permease